jgi:hypothetical protein
MLPDLEFPKELGERFCNEMREYLELVFPLATTNISVDFVFKTFILPT